MTADHLIEEPVLTADAPAILAFTGETAFHVKDEGDL